MTGCRPRRRMRGHFFSTGEWKPLMTGGRRHASGRPGRMRRGWCATGPHHLPRVVGNGHATLPQRLGIRGGFAEVAENVMTVLADDAMFPDDIDAQAARADLTAAEAQVCELSPLDPAFAAADANRRWAQARLDVAGGRS